MRFFCMLFAMLFAASGFAAWETQISPDGKSAVFGNDTGDAAIKNKKMKLFSMASDGNWIEKVFDLTKLPPEWKKSCGSAALRIYMQVADQSRAVKKLPKLNGFTEKLVIMINGKKKIFPVGSTLFPRALKWVDIPITADELKGDTLTFRMGKVKSATNDDYVYVANLDLNVK